MLRIFLSKFRKRKNIRFMRRILSLILVLALLSCALVSCVGNNAGDADGVSQHVHIFEKATCYAPKTCECGATEGKPLNRHTFEGGVCVDCEKELIVELARMVSNTATEEPLDGFDIERDDDGAVKHIAVSADVVDKTLSAQNIYVKVFIKMDQTAVTTGVYEWSIVRNTYIADEDDYEKALLYGTLSAEDFFDVTTLSVTKNEGFDDSEISKYMVYIPTSVDRMVNQYIIPALEENPSGITVDDLGFVNYAEAVTTK